MSKSSFISKRAEDGQKNETTLSIYKRNLELMRQFAESYPDGIYETAVSQITWGHNIVLMQRLERYEDRFWHAQQTTKNGWSRNVLVMWIESELHKRKG